MQAKPDFKTSFLALMEEEREGEHPAAEALAAYRTNDLNAEERQRVHQHLAVCRECAGLSQDLDLFTEAGGTAEQSDGFETAAALRALKPRLVAAPPTPKASWRRPLAVAASLTLAVTASWWLARGVTKREMLAEFSRPWANVEPLNLVEDRSERTGSPAPTVEMMVDTATVLILTPTSPGDFPMYQAEIVTSGGVVVETVQDLERSPYDDTFTLLIPSRGLSLGEYQVKLHGLSGEQSELIASFRLRVIPSPEAPP